MMKITKHILLIALLILIANSAYAQFTHLPKFKPQKIKPKFINPWQTYIDWCVKKPKGPGNYWLMVSLASNQRNGEVTYAAGSLELKTSFYFYGFSGEIEQYFSTRTWHYPTQQGYFPTYHPFDPNKTEKLNMLINTKNNQVILKQGNYSISMKVSWRNGIIHCVETTAPYRCYLISLNKNFTPLVK